MTRWPKYERERSAGALSSYETTRTVERLILILGASGYVGRTLFETLGTANAVATHKSNRINGTLYFDATTMQLGDFLPEAVEITHCFIVFAEADVDACKADICRSRQINVIAIKKVVDDLISRRIKPIFMSSEYVFDGDQGGYGETDLAIPNTVYGGQKREIEQYLEENCSDYAVLRLAKVYGTDPADHTILSTWARQVRSGEKIRCARDQVFSPVHLDDVVAASIAAAESNLSGMFHIAGPNSYSRLEMLQALIAQLETDAEVLECSLRDLEFLDNRPMDLSMNPAKILSTTGLKFQTVAGCCQEFANNLRKEEAAARG